MTTLRIALVTMLAATSWTLCGWAEEHNKVAYTEPEKAGIDFQLQGEYAGQVQTEEGIQKFGAQVIALGEGKFTLVGYVGGLPGAGWEKGSDVPRVESTLKNGEVVFEVEDAQVRLRDAKLTVVHNGETLGTLARTERTSPTLGAKPPAGALVLFDGSTADTFENGKLVEGRLLAASDCSSKEKLGDHQLHLEFRTPFMPAARDQGRGNSGVYVQSRYEVQILDSFGLEGKDNECGGIYSVSAPALNMCLPPLAWQTYDMDFTAARYDAQGKKTQNARITIRHNGVVIHDNLELPHGTPGRFEEGPEPAALYLQDHGNPVVFRNIWVVKK